MNEETETFWKYVEKTKSCWIWKGSKSNSGYGYIVIRAHRFAYELLKEQIPEGLVLDHLCKNKLCVNPEHLEAVTQKENVKRGAIGIVKSLRICCIHGHQYTKENTKIGSDGSRRCRKCDMLAARKRRSENIADSI